MSHIIDFEIEGLAGRIGPIRFKLNRGVNVFFGVNGTGKTSMLRILESALSRDARSLSKVPFQSAQVKIYSIAYGRTFTHTIEKTTAKLLRAKTIPRARRQSHDPIADSDSISRLSESMYEGQPHFNWRISPPLKKSDSTGSWRHGWLPTSRLFFGRNSSSLLLHKESPSGLSEEELDNQFAAALSNIWSRYSAQVLNKIGKAQEAGLARILESVLKPSTRKTKSPRHLSAEMAYNRLSSFLERQKLSSSLGTVEQFIKRYSTDWRLAVVAQDIDRTEKLIEAASTKMRKLEDLIRKLFSGSKTITFSPSSIKVITSQGQELELTTLSSGEKHLLRIFAEAITIDDSTILIDEPELSLHVEWQRDLVSSLRLLNPNSQYILATHSPEIMAELTDPHIFRL